MPHLDDLLTTLYWAALMAPLWALPLAVPSAVVLALRVRNRTWGPAWYAPAPTSCLLLAVLTATTAFGAYGYGLGCGFYFLDPDQMCAAMGIPGDTIVTHTRLPVGAECVTDSGRATELVPSWVNPLVFTCLALCAVAVGAAVAGAVRKRRHQASV
ncbi:hypothetical protein [Streptomyces sp. NPDC005435]|uniref:hypothetical protein n=1 Tax=Streptomyces sp. NPDC005435 TaxID=3154464 RepID=UPI00345216E4